MKPPKNDSPNISLLFPSILQENSHNFLKRSDLIFTIRHDKAIIYKGVYSAVNGKKRNSISDLNLLKRSYQGNLGKSAKKFICKQLTTWSDSVDIYNSYYRLTGKRKKRQLVFATLTLPAPQAHKDNEIKRTCLGGFFELVKYHYGVDHYFWRAEAQKNNNIHFHVIFDRFLPMEHIRDLWNMSIERLGYVTRYAEKHGHFRPPSTHIQMVNQNKHTIKYVLKYATKEEDSRPVYGRLWGMSNSIRSLRTFTMLDDPELKNIILEASQKQKAKIDFQEHFMIINFSKPVVKAVQGTVLERALHQFYMRVYGYLYYSDYPFEHDPSAIHYSELTLDELKFIANYKYT